MEAIIRQILARHRENPPPGIVMTLPIHHQMDVDFCKVISGDLAKHCAMWEKRLATPELWRSLPAESGVYMFVFASPLAFQTTSETYTPAWVLYVGRAGSPTSQTTIRDRYRGEYAKYVGKDPEILWTATTRSTREERMSQYLTIYPLQYWFATISDRSQIPIIEDCLIKLLAPVINGRQLPRLRPQPPQAAFRRIS
jgi:hypothetical protein